jgi:hypothetical protein
MKRKLLILGIGVFLRLSAGASPLPEPVASQDEFLLHKVLGNASCATSGCHGGAGPVHGVVADFAEKDPHARAYATLATPRSARMGEALGIADVRSSPSCTVCHAPAALVPAALAGEDLRVDEGVGCASCHASTDTWLRTHTRLELSHAQKVAAGMRDLRGAATRAQACVACHQTIDAALVDVGRHPRLIFELDGQLRAQPPHWREQVSGEGARRWFVGQAVAWREAVRARQTGRPEPAGAAERERALAWLVRRAGGAAGLDFDAPGDDARDFESWAEKVDATWHPAAGALMLQGLAGCAAELRDPAPSRLEQAYRAERLVLGLDRLLAAWPDRARAAAANPALDALFAAVQSVPDFDPERFARRLEEFAGAFGAGAD